MAFDLKNYEDVQSRVKRWQEAYPMGRIVTEIVEFSAEKGYVLIKASCYRDDETTLPAGVDYAFGNVAFYPTHMKRFLLKIHQRAQLAGALAWYCQETSQKQLCRI